jgi:D-3-phosphoglycerate dehydrogenase
LNLKTIKVLHLDSNHPVLMQGLQDLGFTNEIDFTSTKEEIEAKFKVTIVIRSRFKIDKLFLDKATNLQFIARGCWS